MANAHVSKRFTVLSVAEDKYRSDRITAEQTNYIVGGWTYHRGSAPTRDLKESWLRISVNSQRQLTATVRDFNGRINTIEFDKISVDDLISYLEDVRTYLSEEDLVAQLRGR